MEDIEVDGKKIRRLTVRQGSFITDQELIDMWKSCSDFVHAKNPFQPPRDYESVSKSFKTWVSKISQLLESHIIKLSGGNEFVICYVPFIEGNEIKLTYAREANEFQVPENLG